VYGVAPKRLNEQVKRNQARFPDDFLFRLTLQEAQALLASRSQSATLKRGANVKYAPYAFTEHGALMAATLLNSPLAVEMSIYIVRAFVHRGHESLNGAVVGILKAIHRLQNVPETRAIGFFELDQKKK